MTDLLTLSQAAQIAKRDPHTLRIAIVAGYLKAIRIGRFWLVSPVDLEVWLKTPEYHKPGLKKGQKINRKRQAKST